MPSAPIDDTAPAAHAASNTSAAHRDNRAGAQRVAVLGAGSMGGAIARGAAARGAVVRVTTRSAAAAARYLAAPGITARSLEEHPGAGAWALEQADVVVLGVKPVGIVPLLRDIRADVPAGTPVVSVAAGIPLAAMIRAAPALPLLRAMPNTPAAIGLGVTGLAAAPGVAHAARSAVRAVFAAVGSVVEIEESQIDALGAVSGSGPAYVFLFAEQFRAAAVRLGFSEAQARVLADGTLRGAVQLLADSGDAPEELRRRVTSPNGTTERAIGVFLAHDPAAVFDEALAAAIARSKELAAAAEA